MFDREAKRIKKLDNYNKYLKIAKLISKSSYCNRRKVGCVIVKNKQIISDGYNGNISKLPNICEDDNNETIPTILHAETNAILKCAKRGISCKNSVLYTTLSPCLFCSKLIIQSGIKKVVYKKDYRNLEGIDLLKKCKVKVIKLK
jgi:dCMP deaminase